MTREEYKEFKEEQAALDLARKYLETFAVFRYEYPSFDNMTVKECFDYFSQRRAELNNKIEKLLNVEP